MDDILKIKNLTYGHTTELLFKDLNLTLKYDEWYTLVGQNQSGKTTLVKIICGLLETKGNIEFNFLTLNKKNIIHLIPISALFSILEFIFLKYIGCEYYAVQLFILSTSILIFIILIKTQLNKKKLYIRLREYSTLIFCLHTLVYLFINKFLTFNNSLLIYLTTIFICIIISEIIIFINKKGINIKFLY